MRLIRTANLDGATRGELREDDDTFFCFTLEEPWRDENNDGLGDKSVSRIPAGEFTCKRRWSETRKKEVFEVMHVPGRAAILIHAGNTVADTEGCILLGLAEGELDGEPAVTQSKPAVKLFEERMQGINEFTLVVVDA